MCIRPRRTAESPFRAWSFNRRSSLASLDKSSSRDNPCVGLAVLKAGSFQKRSPVSLLDEVTTAIADAMRKHDAVRLGALRMLKAALMNREVERGRALDDTEAAQVVASLVKQRKESIEQFTKGGRQDLVDKETAEIRVLETYLPPAADRADIDRAIAEAIAETGAASLKDMGRVMKAAMAKLAGQNVDGKAVNELVRRKLGA